MRELMGEQRATLVGRGPVLACAEHDITAHRVGTRCHCTRRGRRTAIVVDAHDPEVEAEARFEEPAGLCVERMTGTRQRCVNPDRC
jgi:hypothetical protein